MGEEEIASLNSHSSLVSLDPRSMLVDRDGDPRPMLVDKDGDPRPMLVDKDGDHDPCS
jgi:hypothetical protein